MGRYTNATYQRNVELDTTNNRRFYQPLLDPEIPISESDIYVMTVMGDRLDLLSWEFYGSSELWWIISAANPEIRKDSLYLDPGIQLRIPTTYQDIILLYKDQNEVS